MFLKKQVLVIGAGFAGLTTAALAKEGFAVRILEKCDSPGSKPGSGKRMALPLIWTLLVPYAGGL